MRIVIDLQAAQSPQSRNRGIGRYATALAKAMLREGSGHEFILALNGMYADTVMPVREAFEGLIPQQRIVTWHAAIPARLPQNAREREPYERIRQSFLASLGPDVVHVASLFEFGACSLTAIEQVPPKHRTAVTLFDLIPHVYRDLYLPNEGARFEYDLKLQHLKSADLWLAISESSRREGVELLQLPQDRVLNISCDADEHFTPGIVSAESEIALRKRHSLLKPFVMYTGGIDPRKNIEGLIEAWSLLPQAMRESHQLAVVCSVQPDERARLEELARRVNLAPGELVLTGFVPEDELVALYRLCKLFVFPSRHEGFGLPALEAMRCGAPVIGSNHSSIPEVIGRADALFDPRSADSISAKLQEVLGDDAFRAELVRFGREQAARFSWQRSARDALAAMEKLGPRPPAVVRAASPQRPRLAYVSPLPPARSGIADYSAELVPALARHYEIDVVVDQPEVDPAVLGAARAVRTPQWFDEHAGEYDRVLYHFGNSEFHEFMLPLLRRHPGTVVLHDFFLSGLQAHRELVTRKQPCWSRALYESHGWHALETRARGGNLAAVIHEFPANFDVLRDAQGVVVHSPYSCELAQAWYGPGAARGWKHVPMLRAPQPLRREQARAELGIGGDEFVVCSFGILGPTKMNDRLLHAWRQSALARDPACRLVFVGQNDAGAFGRRLAGEIEASGVHAQITGWASQELFRQYLNAADVAVQLRTMSRGETSSAVLDAMNHALPVIANADGSMAYLPREAVLLLDAEFTDDELSEALESLRRDPDRRMAMGREARTIIELHHSPAQCAAALASAIETFATEHGHSPAALVRSLASASSAAGATGLSPSIGDEAIASMSRAIAHNEPGLTPARQLFVEVGHWVPGNTQVPSLLEGLLSSPLPGWRVEPVYLDPEGEWRYARRWMLRAAPGGTSLFEDDPIELRRGDVWGLTPGAHVPAEARFEGIEGFVLDPAANAPLAWAAIACGTVAPERTPMCYVDISELVRHDWQSGIQRVVKNELMELLLHPPAGCVVMPVYTVPGKRGYRFARAFLHQLAGLGAPGSDDPDCLPVAGDTFFALDLQPHFIATNESYLRELRATGVRVVFMVYDLLPVQLPDCFHPEAATHHERWLRIVAQADTAVCISAAVAAQLRDWLRANVADAALRDIRCVPLGAGIGHVLASRGLPDDAGAVLDRIRGKPSLLMVGTIEPRKCHAAVLAAFEQLWSEGAQAQLVICGRPGWMMDGFMERLQAHPENGRRLLWICDASDEYLAAIYEAATALVLASRGEGFGLPLVEAAQRGLPIIARDLEVFREVAGEHAFYFRDDTPRALAASLAAWLDLHARGNHPRSDAIRWLTWTESAARLRRILATTR